MCCWLLQLVLVVILPLCFEHIRANVQQPLVLLLKHTFNELWLHAVAAVIVGKADGSASAVVVVRFRFMIKELEVFEQKDDRPYQHHQQLKQLQLQRRT